jgi:hypothetical protein
MLMAEALGKLVRVSERGAAGSLLTLPFLPKSSAPCDLPIPYPEGHSTYLRYRRTVINAWLGLAWLAPYVGNS